MMMPSNTHEQGEKSALSLNRIRAMTSFHETAFLFDFGVCHPGLSGMGWRFADAGKGSHSQPHSYPDRA